MTARLIPFGALPAALNMAVDELLLARSEVPVLRFYGWDPPAISLGRFQPGRVDLGPWRDTGLPLVRRMTGGGAIVHWHEVTYSLVLPADHPWIRGVAPRESYARLHEPFVQALSDLGVEAVSRGTDLATAGPDPFLCFHRTTSLDLVSGGRKLLGSAQRRVDGRVLQHGSLIIEETPLQPGTASLRTLLGRRPAPDEITSAIRRRIAPALGPLASRPLDQDELRDAEALVRAATSVDGVLVLPPCKPVRPTQE